MAAASPLPIQCEPPLPLPAAAVHVGYSGGLDSTVLLHLLAEAHPGRVHAVHVHHGLHPEADAWAGHCMRACEALGVPLHVARVHVSATGEGREAAARRSRHAALAAAMAPGDILALAHHLDDQAETFLLRALRASSVDGLAAMRPWRAHACGWLWRPLLAVPRGELQAYARAHGLAWIEDPSNADDSLDRNFLRHRVLPRLRERWPGAAAALALSATLSAEATDLLAADDSAALATARGVDPATLSIPALLALATTRRPRVLRRWISECGMPPLPAQGIASIEHDLLPALPDRQAEFAWHGACIRAWRGWLHVERTRDALSPDWCVQWDGHGPLALPGGGELRLDGCGGFDVPLRVQARRGGERLRLPGRSHRHALKHVLQELGVPPWVRARMPLLFDGEGHLLAAADLAYAESFDAWLRARGARLYWYDEADVATLAASGAQASAGLP
jgi:tRNA(Ile)-lysidine synthase